MDDYHILLHLFMDDKHFNFVTKLKKKQPCAAYT